MRLELSPLAETELVRIERILHSALDIRVELIPGSDSPET
jgi:hypothetical protein